MLMMQFFRSEQLEYVFLIKFFFSISPTARKRQIENKTKACKRRKLSSEDACEKEKAKLDLIELRARAWIKARIRARVKSREAEEKRLLALKALRENGWSDFIPYEVLLRIFQRVVDDSGQVPFLCR